MDNIAVRTENEKEWREVVCFAKKTTSPTYDYPSDTIDLCVNVNDGRYSNEQWYINNSYKVISFQDFQRDYLKITPEIDLIEGNWYHLKTKNYDGQEWLFKRKFGKYKTEHTSAIYIKDGNKYRSGFITSDDQIDWIKPADMDTVYKYFPEERPKTESFNIGDYITVTDSEFGKDFILIGTVTLVHRNDNMDDGYDRGRATFIKSGHGNGFYISDEWAYSNKSGTRKWRKSNSDEIKWLENCIKAGKFIPKEEIFKSTPNLIGRYLKALVDTPQDIGPMKAGDYARIYGNQYIEIWNYGKLSRGWVYSPTSVQGMVPNTKATPQWELMPEGFIPDWGKDPNPTTNLLPIGTKVRINPNGRFPEQGNGNIGEIRKYIRDSGYQYEVRWDSKNSNVYANQDIIVVETEIKSEILANGSLYVTGIDPYHNETKPLIKIEGEACNIKIPKSASVTLKNIENEVKIKVNNQKSIKI